MRIPSLCLLMLAFVASVHADDRPSWAIIDAADRLIAKNALFLPGGDGFLKQRSGLLIQYERPSKSYVRDGKKWMIVIKSPRWRAEAAKEWLPWNDARPKYDHWRIGVIRVDVLLSGVEASWVDDENFRERTPPTQSEITHRLDTLGQASARKPDNHASRSNQGPASEVRNHKVRSDKSSQGGIFRKLPDGSLKDVLPQQIPRISTPSAPSPHPRVVPPPAPSPPQSQTTPDPSSPLPGNVAGFSPLELNFGWIIPSIVLALTTIAGILLCILGMKRKTPIPSHAHSSPGSLPLAAPFTFPTPKKTTPTTFKPNHFMSPAESSFLAALQQAVGPSWTIATKIRAANLFDEDSIPGKKMPHASACETLIDFVIYHPSESRILCAIELDENSNARPDRSKRDSFLSALFESNQVPLLRIPISWTYYPQGIRAELQKAGILSA